MAFPYVPGKRVEVPEIPYRQSITLPAASTALYGGDVCKSWRDIRLQSGKGR
jgi:hypothetical protein